MKEKTCCFTGHRIVPEKDVDRILDRVNTLVRALVKKGVRYFSVGGAIGVDYTGSAVFILSSGHTAPEYQGYFGMSV